jgi:hypothetical protein
MIGSWLRRSRGKLTCESCGESMTLNEWSIMDLGDGKGSFVCRHCGARNEIALTAGAPAQPLQSQGEPSKYTIGLGVLVMIVILVVERL